MERIAFTYRFRPGKKEEYLQAHAELWPSQHDALERSGVRRMVVFVRGEHLFLYADVENREEFIRISQADPDYQSWGVYMATMLEQPFDEDEPGIFAELEEVWDWTP